MIADQMAFTPDVDAGWIEFGRRSAVGTASHVEDVSVQKHASRGIVVERRLVLLDLVLSVGNQAATNSILVDEESVVAKLRAALQSVVVEVVNEIVMELQVLHVSQKREIVIVGKLAPREFDVLIPRLSVAEQDLVRRCASILHVSTRRPWCSQPTEGGMGDANVL